MDCSFADFCRSLRKRKGLSQKQLAEKSSISLRTVVYWETGQREPRTEELERALRVLGATETEAEQAYLLQTTQRGITRARRQIQGDAVTDHCGGSIPELGDLLMATRNRRGWTREQLAQQMGVNRSTIVRWERTEQMPTEENLDRLCALLDVYPSERHALLTRRLLSPTSQRPTSLTSCEQSIQCFCDSIDQLVTPLVDIEALTLKRHLYLAARSSPHYEGLIARIETYHAKWLVLQDRFPEATVCIQRALELVLAGPVEDHFLHLTLNLASCCAGAKKPNGPEKSLRLLQCWKSFACRPQAQFLIYSDIAYYTAQAGRHEMALHLMHNAHTLMETQAPSESRLTYYNITQARVLSLAGRPGEALDLIPETSEPDYRNVFYTYLRAGMLLDAGETGDAHRCIDRVYALLQQYPSRLLQKRTDELAARIQFTVIQQTP